MICPEKFFWYARKNFFGDLPPRSPKILEKFSLLILPIRANYTVPPQKGLGPYAHAHSSLPTMFPPRLPRSAGSGSLAST